jgi:hypothetical protein
MGVIDSKIKQKRNKMIDAIIPAFLATLIIQNSTKRPPEHDKCERWNSGNKIST